MRSILDAFGVFGENTSDNVKTDSDGITENLQHEDFNPADNQISGANGSRIGGSEPKGVDEVSILLFNTML